MDVDSVARELYALPREEFTSARNAKAGEVGDGHLAAAIRKLRKPTVAAWLADAVAREHPGEIAELAEVGEALRQAQQELAGTTLRELSARRHEVVRELLRLATGVGKEHGQPVGEATVRQLEDTFTAATTDGAVAEALRDARLDRAAEPGTAAWPEPGTVDLSPTPPARRGKKERTPPKPEPKRKPDPREREWARHVARRARRALEDAERDADGKARERRQAEAAVDDVRKRLDAARRAARKAAQSARRAAEHRDAAAREAEAADQRLRALEG